MPEFVLDGSSGNAAETLMKIVGGLKPATTVEHTSTPEPKVGPKRIKPKPEMKYGLVDQLTINFLSKWAEDADRFHAILLDHLEGTRTLDVNQTRILLRVLDIVADACGDIELHTAKPAKKQNGAAKPPAPAMRS